MSEKRFERFNDAIPIVSDKNGDNVKGIEEIVALLNNLYDENEELRKDLSDCEKFRYSVFKRIGELADERKRD